MDEGDLGVGGRSFGMIVSDEKTEDKQQNLHAFVFTGVRFSHRYNTEQ